MREEEEMTRRGTLLAYRHLSFNEDGSIWKDYLDVRVYIAPASGGIAQRWSCLNVRSYASGEIFTDLSKNSVRVEEIAAIYPKSNIKSVL